LGRVLSRLGRSYLHLLNSRLNHLDLVRNYYALMLIEPRDGKITQNELASLLETDKVSIVRVIDYLAAKGYVDRVRSSYDRRKYCLTLTAKAKTALPGIRKSVEDVTKIAFAGLTESQISAFFKTLETLKTNLNRTNPNGI
jgi:MarR family transcriptional regulator, transcriptional regulator for hemolysin